MTDPKGSAPSSRREFLSTTAVAAGATALLGVVPSVHAAGSDSIKIGVIGCGGRGTGAAANTCTGNEGVTIHAMGDLFKDNLDNSLNKLKNDENCKGKLNVTDDRCFTGFDAYKKVIDSGIDMVILASPPGFRPMMLEYAVKAGKNIFTEKPVGVDGPGIRRVLAAYEEAKSKGLGIVAGTQRRHQAPYLESIKRIQAGAIGEITSARCYWDQGALWHRSLKEKAQKGWSDMEWQVRNWLYFTWLSGDHIVEQHVHNLDVINWALTKDSSEPGHPLSCLGLGGRQVRTAPDFGNIYDHFAIEYVYPDDVHVQSFCRQIENTDGNVSEAIVGTKGTFSTQSNRYVFTGANRGRVDAKGIDPYVQEHKDLVASIRESKPLNELKTVAFSTLTAIMGRMSAYTGKQVTWDQALNSKLDTMPKELTFEGTLPIPPVAMPGITELV
jgi:myo-inositol 2-dehydrogenase/D-chiro-inositol 1-dehydrogenase